jgi:hypothetical protein
MRRVWLAGALIVLTGPLVTWSNFLRAHRLEVPASPTENDQPELAAYWRFLAAARPLVPAGSSYTIKASTLDAETQLFMLSAGLYADVRPYPATYVWQPQPGGGSEAKYVLVYGAPECPPDAPSMHIVTGGAVCVRDRNGALASPPAGLAASRRQPARIASFAVNQKRRRDAAARAGEDASAPKL